MEEEEEGDEAGRYYGSVGLRSRVLGVVVDVLAVSVLGVGVRRLQVGSRVKNSMKDRENCLLIFSHLHGGLAGTHERVRR